MRLTGYIEEKRVCVVITLNDEVLYCIGSYHLNMLQNNHVTEIQYNHLSHL